MFIKLTRAALAAAALSVLAPAAIAGECPADKVKAGATQPSAAGPAGVTDKVIGAIDLARKSDAFKGQQFRLRELVVQPGGIVPWHSHAERPALIYIVEGSITEHRSSCAVPIEHKAGEVTAEFGADLMHWWKNDSGRPTRLISADIFHDKMKDDQVM